MRNQTYFPLFLILLASWQVQQALAQDSRPQTGSLTNKVINTAVMPTLRNDPTNWVSRQAEFNAEAKTNNVPLLFIGDSITDFWRNRGSNVWKQYYAPRHAANFGISGDRTQNVLWRIDHGELDGLNPKVVVLLIGTNNSGNYLGEPNSTLEIIEGVEAVVNRIRSKLPKSRILLLGIFPLGSVDSVQRSQVAVVNTVLAKLDNGSSIRFLDIGSSFIGVDGELQKTLVPDWVHPNEKGYQIWAEAMEPTLSKMID